MKSMLSFLRIVVMLVLLFVPAIAGVVLLQEFNRAFTWSFKSFVLGGFLIVLFLPNRDKFTFKYVLLIATTPLFCMSVGGWMHQYFWDKKPNLIEVMSVLIYSFTIGAVISLVLFLLRIKKKRPE